MAHILSIDDSRAVHAFLTGIFADTKTKLSHAMNGKEAIALLEAKQLGDLDLILLDWEMPELTGIETLKVIRGLGINTPVMMLTSKNSPDEIREALLLGANEYVMKPFTQELLFEKIEMVTGKRPT